MYLAEFINVCGHQQRIKMMNREPLFLPDCSKASTVATAAPGEVSSAKSREWHQLPARWRHHFLRKPILVQFLMSLAAASWLWRKTILAAI